MEIFQRFSPNLINFQWPFSVEMEIKLFCTSRDHMINELVRATKLYKENIDVLQIGASFCYKLGQLFFITS